MEEYTLAKFVVWLVSSGGAGTAAFWLMENVKWLTARPAIEKRWWAFGLSGGLAIGAWGIGIAMRYFPLPIDWRAWIEGLFAVAAPAIVASQGLHAMLKLKKTANGAA